MKIAFVTGSLEPGHDGVGDYTRWLAIEAVGRGVGCRLLAIADRHQVEPQHTVDPHGIETLRLPCAMPWRTRLGAATRFLRAAPPDWVSLQFVPYSFQKRGFAGALVGAVPALAGGARLHVMLHEIWIDGRASLRERLVSAVQRRAVLTLCRYPDALIDTSNGTYQRALAEHAIAARVRPLFGSIPIAGSDATPWLAPVLEEAGCGALADRRADWWLFALFGALHPIWPPLPLLTELETAAAAAGKRVALVSAGRLGAGERLWSEMYAAHGGRIPMVRLGEQAADRISALLHTVDFGIATTPLALIGKSATVAAMLDHGLPVVVNREDCDWPAPPMIDPREIALIIRMGPGFAARLGHARRQPPVWRLPEVATQWLEDLRNATVSSL